MPIAVYHHLLYPRLGRLFKSTLTVALYAYFGAPVGKILKSVMMYVKSSGRKHCNARLSSSHLNTLLFEKEWLQMLSLSSGEVCSEDSIS
jgi:hypothetical protein